MEMQSYFQERVAFFTARTILAAVMEGPDGIFTGSFCPVIRSLTFVPPTSIVRMRCGSGFARVVFFNGVTSWEQSRRYIPERWIVKLKWRARQAPPRACCRLTLRADQSGGKPPHSKNGLRGEVRARELLKWMMMVRGRG